MISFRRSSAALSPPWRSGWCCFTSALKRALSSSSVKPTSSVQHGHHLLDLGHGPARPPARLGRLLAEQAEHVAPVLIAACPGAEAPGRPVPGDVRALMLLDLGRAHAGEEVPLAVELAHMVEAEELELAQPVARHGCPIGPALPAAGPGAAPLTLWSIDRLEAQRLRPFVLADPAYPRHGTRLWSLAGRPQAAATARP